MILFHDMMITLSYFFILKTSHIAKECKTTFAEAPHPLAFSNRVPASALFGKRHSKQNTHAGNLSQKKGLRKIENMVAHLKGIVSQDGLSKET
jgi:hypothetical protein